MDFGSFKTLPIKEVVRNDVSAGKSDEGRVPLPSEQAKSKRNNKQRARKGKAPSKPDSSKSGDEDVPVPTDSKLNRVNAMHDLDDLVSIPKPPSLPLNRNLEILNSQGKRKTVYVRVTEDRITMILLISDQMDLNLISHDETGLLLTSKSDDILKIHRASDTKNSVLTGYVSLDPRIQNKVDIILAKALTGQKWDPSLTVCSNFDFVDNPFGLSGEEKRDTVIVENEKITSQNTYNVKIKESKDTDDTDSLSDLTSVDDEKVGSVVVNIPDTKLPKDQEDKDLNTGQGDKEFIPFQVVPRVEDSNPPRSRGFRVNRDSYVDWRVGRAALALLLRNCLDMFKLAPTNSFIYVWRSNEDLNDYRMEVRTTSTGSGTRLSDGFDPTSENDVICPILFELIVMIACESNHNVDRSICLSDIQGGLDYLYQYAGYPKQWYIDAIDGMSCLVIWSDPPK